MTSNLLTQVIAGTRPWHTLTDAERQAIRQEVHAKAYALVKTHAQLEALFHAATKPAALPN